MMSEPNANVPKWYLNVLIVDFVTTKNGKSLFLNVQYHVENVAAKTISANPDTKNNNQNSPKIFITCKYVIIFAESTPIK